MAKKKKEDVLNLDNVLFKCRDILRNARNSGSFFEKRDLMLTLVFLRFIGEKFEDGVEALRENLRQEGLNPDEPEIQKAFFDDPSFTDGTYNLPKEARWSTIINTPAPKLNAALDTALKSISESSNQLKGCIVNGTFTARNLGSADIKKVVDEVDKISHKKFGEEKDLIGRVYEYFLKEFAVNATKEEGEFYTPHDAVQLIAAMIEPFDGTLYDPCCGSGGMFIQSTDLVRAKMGDISRINVYGQEKEAATWRLAKMNLALRGISHNLGTMSDSSFTNDLHRGLYFDYIMANPPFNLKGWWDDNLLRDSRWTDYAIPPASNANYAWILHILHHIKPLTGVAGFLLSNGALADSDAKEIRQKLIENDKVEAIIILPRDLFITTDISVTLWILNQNKRGGNYHGRNLRNRSGEILFMDLRSWRENAVKGEGKKKVMLDTNQIERAADIYHRWQEMGTDGFDYACPELYRSVYRTEIADNDYSLVPSNYIEFIDHDLEIDYPTEMARIQQEMKDLLARERKSQEKLAAAFEGIGYGIENDLDDTKLIEGIIDGLQRNYVGVKLGKYLKYIDRRNEENLDVSHVRGLSIDKKLIPTKANMQDVGLDKYKVLEPNQFAYVPVTSRNGEKITIALNDSSEKYLVSSAYEVFGVDGDMVCPEYLMMYFSQQDFDRYARFHSWGSARETFDWSEMCKVEIPLPDIITQRAVADIYNCFIERKRIAEEIQGRLKDVCSVLMRRQ